MMTDSEKKPYTDKRWHGNPLGIPIGKPKKLTRKQQIEDNKFLKALGLPEKPLPKE